MTWPNVLLPLPCTAIEHLWSAAKSNFRKLLTLTKEELTEDHFLSLVKQALEMIPQTTIDNLVVSNRRYITQKLNSISK